LEERKISKATEYIAEGFVGNSGLDKNTITRVLLGQFLRHKNITVVITRSEVTVNPNDPYTATLQGVVAAAGAENLLPQDGRIYSINSEWQLIDDEWMLIRMQWK
jgi:hypothetical protein